MSAAGEGLPPDDAARIAHVEAGLYWRGMRAESDGSVLHRWAGALPLDMFDGHWSAMPARDHLLFLGLTRKFVQCAFTMTPTDFVPRLACLFRDAMVQAGHGRVHLYNAKKPELVNSFGISQWAAALTVAPHAVNRALPDHALMSNVTSGCVRVPFLTLLGEVLDILQRLCNLVCLAMFCPRVELDGTEACTNRHVASTRLDGLAEDILRAICRVCLRGDCATVLAILDVPNLHRFRELFSHVTTCLGGLRYFQALLLKSSHQTLKRAISCANGHDDAHRAMSTLVESEIMSRVRLQPYFFSLPDHWSIQPLQRDALPLWSHDRGARGPGRALAKEVSVPPSVRELVSSDCDNHHFLFKRRKRHRGEAQVICPGEAISVLAMSFFGVRNVHSVRVWQESLCGVHMSFFRVVALFEELQRGASAVVHPFVPTAVEQMCTEDTSCLLVVEVSRSVRRAMALHDCTGRCRADEALRMVQDGTIS